MDDENLVLKKVNLKVREGNWRDIAYQLRKNFSSENIDELIQEISQLRKGKNSIIYAQSQEKTVGLIALESLEWDSSFFGSPMARIKYFLVAEGEDALNVAKYLLQGALDEAKRMGISHLTCRIKAENFFSIWALERLGFDLTDVGTTLTFDLEKTPIKAVKRKYRIRPSLDKDIGELSKIASVSFKTGRFYVDPFLRKRARDFYVEWIKNLHNGLAHIVWVIEVKNRPVGFAACSVGEENEEGNIPLIAISHSHRGTGLGTQLIYHALNWFKGKVKRVNVRTQAINYPALNLYQKVGFKITQTDMTFSKSL